MLGVPPPLYPAPRAPSPLWETPSPPPSVAPTWGLSPPSPLPPLEKVASSASREASWGLAPTFSKITSGLQALPSACRYHPHLLHASAPPAHQDLHLRLLCYCIAHHPDYCTVATLLHTSLHCPRPAKPYLTAMYDAVLKFDRMYLAFYLSRSIQGTRTLHRRTDESLICGDTLEAGGDGTTATLTHTKCRLWTLFVQLCVRSSVPSSPTKHSMPLDKSGQSSLVIQHLLTPHFLASYLVHPINLLRSIWCTWSARCTPWPAGLYCLKYFPRTSLEDSSHSTPSPLSSAASSQVLLSSSCSMLSYPFPPGLLTRGPDDGTRESGCSSSSRQEKRSQIFTGQNLWQEGQGPEVEDRGLCDSPTLCPAPLWGDRDGSGRTVYLTHISLGHSG